MRQYRRLLSYLRPYLWPRFVLAVACMLSRSAVETSVPFLARFTFDQVFHQQHPEALPLVVFLVLGAAFLRGGLDFVGGYLNDWVGQRVVTDLRNELTAHIQRLDLAFFNRRRAGQIVSRVISDVGIVRGAVTDAVTSIFQEFPTLVGLTVTVFYLDWVLALLAICLFPAAALPIRYLSLQLRQTTRRMQDGIGRLNALLHENVQGNRVVKAFGQEGYEQRRFGEHNERLLRIYMRTSVLRALPITEMLAGIAVAGIIWYGGSSVISGARTQGSFMAFIIALFLLYEPFKKLVRTNNTIQQGLAGAERVFELLDTASQVVDRPGAVALRGVRAAIEFHAVSFAYDPGEPVLRDINLRIPVGQVVALSA